VARQLPWEILKQAGSPCGCLVFLSALLWQNPPLAPKSGITIEP